MRRFFEIAGLIVVIAGAACGGAGDATSGKPAHAQCNVHAGRCETKIGDRVITMDITPKPVRVMEDLKFVVTVGGKPPKDPPYIDLNMVAMDMGPNRVEMQEMWEGSYEGRGVIVKCPSGRKRWKALVTVPGVGAAEFYFDVRD